MSEDIEIKRQNKIATQNAIDDILMECENLGDREYCRIHCSFAKRCDSSVTALELILERTRGQK